MKSLAEALRETEYFLLDMDGTLYIGDELIGNMPQTLSFLREKGKKIVYLTNNSSKDAEEYREKLGRLSLWGEGDIVYSSGEATAEYLLTNFPDKKVYLVGTDALKKEFSARGVLLVDEDPDICVLAYDTTLTYRKLCDLTRFLFGGAYYIATHPDVNCPAPGAFVPDVGSFIELIAASTGRRPDFIVGKPFTGMGENLERKFSAPKEKFMMAGDRMHTDIRFGNSCGFHSLLVLSGETTKETMGNYPDRPEFVLNDFNEVVRYF